MLLLRRFATERTPLNLPIYKGFIFALHASKKPFDCVLKSLGALFPPLSTVFSFSVVCHLLHCSPATCAPTIHQRWRQRRNPSAVPAPEASRQLPRGRVELLAGEVLPGAGKCTNHTAPYVTQDSTPPPLDRFSKPPYRIRR